MSHDTIDPSQILDPNKDTRPYRANVGIVLTNSHGKVWVGSRIDMPTQHWQLPQGGVDEGEDLEKAMWRELEEETNVKKSDATIIDAHKDWLTYDLPHDLSLTFWGGQYRGQKQKWYVLRLNSDDSVININTVEPEFKDWKWVDISDIPSLIVPFKKDIYQKLVNDFSHLCK